MVTARDSKQQPDSTDLERFSKKKKKKKKRKEKETEIHLKLIKWQRPSRPGAQEDQDTETAW